MRNKYKLFVNVFQNLISTICHLIVVCGCAAWVFMILVNNYIMECNYLIVFISYFYITYNSVAIDGSDYTGGVYNVTFTKGSSEAELHIPITDDDKPESDETFSAMLMIPDSAEGVEAGEDRIATVTITDDDKKLVNFNPIEYSVSENGTYVIVMLMLNTPAEENCTVKVMTIDGTAIGIEYIGFNVHTLI